MNKRYCKYCKREIIKPVHNQQYHLECRKINQRSKDKAYYKDKAYQHKLFLLELKINGCAICGYNRCPTALEFHHVNIKDKSFLLNTHCI